MIKTRIELKQQSVFKNNPLCIQVLENSENFIIKPIESVKKEFIETTENKT